MSIRDIARAPAIFAGLASLAPLCAEAHHAMEGQTPRTALEGLLSGLAHPVLGLDHFLFVLAMGAACYYFGKKAAMIIVFLAGTVAGTVLHLYESSLAYPEVWVAGSLVLLGILILSRSRFLTSKAAVGMFAICGIAHGYAYGESIVGAEPAPLSAYLIGFTLVQLLIVFASYTIARHIDRKGPSINVVRTLGGGLAGAGVVFLYRALT